MRLFGKTHDIQAHKTDLPLMSPTHTNRVLLSSTEEIAIIISSSVAILFMVFVFGFLYYRKFFHKPKEKTEEELEEERELEDMKLRLENEKEWEERRFSKLRYIGNSDFHSWQLIKKVRIIEGMSQDIKAVKKREEPTEKSNMEETRAGNEKSENTGDPNSNTAKDLNVNPNESQKDESKINTEDGSQDKPTENNASKLPELNQRTLNSTSRKNEEVKYELKPTDTKVDVFYVNAQRTAKTPGRLDLEESRRKLLEEDEERYRTGNKRTHASEVNTQARTTLKNTPDGQNSKQDLEDQDEEQPKYRRLST